MNILGISAFYHDSAACLVRDGEIIAAAQEERFTRKKHDADFPARAVAYCLREGGIAAADLDYVGFYDKPFIKFERILETYLSLAPAGLQSCLKAMPLWLKDKLWTRRNIRARLDYNGPILFAEHHESHAASAFFPSPFAEAAILTMDGVGEWATSSVGAGRGRDMKILKELRFPHSLGLLYSAFTYYLGFKVNSGEYKVMGLAPYGQPKYAGLMRERLLDIKEDGSLRMNMEYFNYLAGLTMTNDNFSQLFGAPPRDPESRLTQREMDIAASLQAVTEEVMLKMARYARRLTGMKNLCLAGGVALNCVGNGKILKENIFDQIWVQPAAGDAGGALGIAMYIWHQALGKERAVDGNDRMRGSYLGPRYEAAAIRGFLDRHQIAYRELEEGELMREVAGHIRDGKVIGWFQGRMEFGPRALGARSIIGDARNPDMQSVMNLKIKYRESFRPFAPSVLEEKAHEWFDLSASSPYMLLVAPVREDRKVPAPPGAESLFGIDLLKAPRSQAPAITHVDYSARIQTVSRAVNPRYYELIRTFDAETGCPVIINTSFNVRGEPIVCTPEEAYRCFMRTGIDYLALENFLLDKRAQKPLEQDTDWRREFELD